MDVAELQERFAVPGVLGFEQTAPGLVVARITGPAAEATVYLQGAHLTDWKPVGQAPVLFLSARSEFAPGKAIRGGVPVIFPWFGPRHDGKAGPQHGFARTAVWDLAFAAVAGDDLHLTFTLAPSEASRKLGFGDLRAGVPDGDWTQADAGADGRERFGYGGAVRRGAAYVLCGGGGAERDGGGACAGRSISISATGCGASCSRRVR